jgi:hypothetical protein
MAVGPIARGGIAAIVDKGKEDLGGTAGGGAEAGKRSEERGVGWKATGDAGAELAKVRAADGGLVRRSVGVGLKMTRFGGCVPASVADDSELEGCSWWNFGGGSGRPKSVQGEVGGREGA